MFLIPASSLQLVWSPTAQSGVLRAPSAVCWFSLPHLISNWLNFLCTVLYDSSTATFFLCASQIALIQPVHGQGYLLIFLDRMHLLFTQVYFLFWQLGQGQYVTWVGKVIHWELCKELKFDHTNKCTAKNLSRRMRHKLPGDFDIQTDHLISARRPDLIIISNNKKENLQNCELCCPSGLQSQIKRKRKEEVSRPC